MDHKFNPPEPKALGLHIYPVSRPTEIRDP